MKPTLLGFGAMRLPTDTTECRKMFNAYIESGGNYFDTAYVYTGSEEMLGKTLVKEHPRSKYLVSTKIPTWTGKSIEDCDNTLQTSLRRTGLDYIDYYLLHSLGESSEKRAVSIGMYQWAQQMKKKGLVRQVGMSFHDTPEVLDKLLTAHPEVEFVMIQLNYVDVLHGPSGGFHEVALKHKKPIIGMEPIKGGTLASLPAEAEALLKSARPQDSIAAWAMRYVASMEGMMSVLSGMSNLAQTEDNIRTFKDFEPMKAEEYALLEKVMDILGKEANIPCTGCKYCLAECPEGIKIDNCLTMYNEFQRNPDSKFNRAEIYRSIPRGKRAEDCTACGACLSHCPQKIDVPEALKIVAKEFA